MIKLATPSLQNIIAIATATAIAFKYKAVCHVVLIYGEDLSGYRLLVVGVHGFVFEESRLARHYLPTTTSLYYYIFRVCYSILDIYHTFKYKAVCHVVLIYGEDLSGYRFLVVGVHGFVFEECRLARQLPTTIVLLRHHYNTSSKCVIVCHAVLLYFENLFKWLLILLGLLIVRRNQPDLM